MQGVETRSQGKADGSHRHQMIQPHLLSAPGYWAATLGVSRAVVGRTGRVMAAAGDGVRRTKAAIGRVGLEVRLCHQSGELRHVTQTAGRTDAPLTADSLPGETSTTGRSRIEAVTRAGHSLTAPRSRRVLSRTGPASSVHRVETTANRFRIAINPAAGLDPVTMTVGHLDRTAGRVSTRIVTRAVTATRAVVTVTTRVSQCHLATVFPVVGTARLQVVLTSTPSSKVVQTVLGLHLMTTRWTSGVEVDLRVIIRWTSGGAEPHPGTVRWSSEVVAPLRATVGWTSRVSEIDQVMSGRQTSRDVVCRVAMASKVVVVSREHPLVGAVKVKRTTGRGQWRQQTRMTVVCPVIAWIRTSLGRVRVSVKTRSLR